MKVLTQDPATVGELVGATQRGREIPTVDDGFDGDGLYVLRESLGIVGIVRAMTWEVAWEVCEDCLLNDADPDDPDTWDDPVESIPAEGIGWRPNGPPSDDPETNPLGLKSYLYAQDLNGCRLDRLTPESLAEWDIYLTFERED